MKELKLFLHEYLKINTLSELNSLRGMSTAQEMYRAVTFKVSELIKEIKDQDEPASASQVSKLEHLQFVNRILKRAINKGTPREVIDFSKKKNLSDHQKLSEVAKVIRASNTWV